MASGVFDGCVGVALVLGVLAAIASVGVAIWRLCKCVTALTDLAHRKPFYMLYDNARHSVGVERLEGLDEPAGAAGGTAPQVVDAVPGWEEGLDAEQMIGERA